MQEYYILWTTGIQKEEVSHKELGNTLKATKNCYIQNSTPPQVFPMVAFIFNHYTKLPPSKCILNSWTQSTPNFHTEKIWTSLDYMLGSSLGCFFSSHLSFCLCAWCSYGESRKPFFGLLDCFLFLTSVPCVADGTRFMCVFVPLSYLSQKSRMA